MKFTQIFHQSELLLTEGAIAQRLKSTFHLRMDDHINHSGLIYEAPEIVESLYRQYIGIAEQYDLPILIMTPTRRVNKSSLLLSGFSTCHLLTDAVHFLNRICAGYPNFSSKILIGGLLGCKGDAYSGERVMDSEAAYHFHRHQTAQFQQENIDFLMAGIMPEIHEAVGMARAMAETNLPYLISFMIQSDGCLLDGTPLSEAIAMVDQQSFAPPVCYLTNCIHPINLLQALNQPCNRNHQLIKTRFSGIQANASQMSCHDLNHCATVQQGDTKAWLEGMAALQREFGFKIWGGCCGTDERYLESLAQRLMLG